MYTNLSPFFDGANLGRRMTHRFDATSWAAQSVQVAPGQHTD